MRLLRLIAMMAVVFTVLWHWDNAGSSDGGRDTDGIGQGLLPGPVITAEPVEKEGLLTGMREGKPLLPRLRPSGENSRWFGRNGGLFREENGRRRTLLPFRLGPFGPRDDTD